MTSESGRSLVSAYLHAAIGLSAATVFVVAVSRAGLWLAPEPVVATLASSVVGALLAAATVEFLNHQLPGSLMAATAGASLLPSSILFSTSGSLAALVWASVAVSIAATELLAIGLAATGRLARGVVDGRRKAAGRPPLDEAAVGWLNELPEPAFNAVVLGSLASVALAATALIDKTPDLPPGVVGSLATLLARVAGVIESAAISLLAGALVLYAQTMPIVPRKRDDQTP